MSTASEAWTALDAALSGLDGPEVQTAAEALADAALAALCQREDHRLCEASDCAHAGLWWPRVLTVGGAALAASGRRWAVLCLVPACSGVDREPRLLLTTDSLASATGCRNSHYRSHGGYERRGVPSVHGWCPMVERDDDGPRIA